MNSYFGDGVNLLTSPIVLSVSDSSHSQQLWGLLEYKPQWTLTLQGWCLVLLLITAGTLFIFLTIQPFLAVSVPMNAKVLVVEGWVNDETLKGAIAEFKKKNYQLMITTGVLFNQQKYLTRYQSRAHLTAAKAIALGLDPLKVVAVTNSMVKVNRTAASAMAVKDWLFRSNLKITRLNLYSYNVHTRRSWIIFRQVLAPKIKVGAIAHPPSGYNPKQWWTASEGVRSVTAEAIAYLYVFLIWRYQQKF